MVDNYCNQSKLNERTINEQFANKGCSRTHTRRQKYRERTQTNTNEHKRTGVREQINEHPTLIFTCERRHTEPNAEENGSHSEEELQLEDEFHGVGSLMR